MKKKKPVIYETRESYFQVRITESEKKELKDVSAQIREPVSRIARKALERQLHEIRRQIDAGEPVTL